MMDAKRVTFSDTSNRENFNITRKLRVNYEDDNVQINGKFVKTCSKFGRNSKNFNSTFELHLYGRSSYSVTNECKRRIEDGLKKKQNIGEIVQNEMRRLRENVPDNMRKNALKNKFRSPSALEVISEELPPSVMEKIKPRSCSALTNFENTKELISKSEVRRLRKKIEKKASVNTTDELQKSKYYINKCRNLMKDLGVYLDINVLPLDGPIEYNKKYAKTKEFVAIFPTVYLKHIQKILNNMPPKILEQCRDVHPNFTTMFHVAFQALYTCKKYFPLTSGIAWHENLKRLLEQMVEICNENRKVRDSTYLEDDVRDLLQDCNLLLKKLDDNFLSPEMIYLRKRRRDLRMRRQMERNNCEGQKGRDRFSMYSTSMVAMMREKKKDNFKSVTGIFDRNWKSQLENQRETEQDPPEFQPIGNFNNEENSGKNSSQMNDEKDDVLMKLLEMARNNENDESSDKSFIHTILTLQNCLNLKAETAEFIKKANAKIPKDTNDKRTLTIE